MPNTEYRTSRVLDENFVQEALKLINIKTKLVLINTALIEFVANLKQTVRKQKAKPDIRDLKGIGGLYEDYDYKALRKTT